MSLLWPRGGCLLLVLIWSSAAQAVEDDALRLTRELTPLLGTLSGSEQAYSISADVRARIDGRPQEVSVRVARLGDESFDLDVKHPEYWLQLQRRGDVTAMALPYHKVVFLGRGATDAVDHLAPPGIMRRLIGSGSQLGTYAASVGAMSPPAVSFLLTSVLGARYDAVSDQWKIGDRVSLRLSEDDRSAHLTVGDVSVQTRVGSAAELFAGEDWQAYRTVEIDRTELERQLARGVRRALEILAPSTELTAPRQVGRRVEHGELRWIEGQRVAILQGSPEQIGRAHGQLLKAEALRCVDSVLYTFGTVQTIRTGQWFRHELEAAYGRLAPHIPADHIRETHALAGSLDLDPQLVAVVNVFPEMFHCSGFALFGTATRDGKLYHGRVLDYMTTIGLQDAATTFIVAVDGKIPFANVGYGGFIGSVSGMNAQAISLGEMGGRGEGDWDGTPMATLMRRALEECSTLDDVIALWTNSPRTCEYYYVFADGKTNRAVGVAAVPESIEFIQPGQSDPRLGEGIVDAVVLSAGDRLELLRQRVTEEHGAIDAEVAQWLMSRPVAMRSNLHNVLFVPADGVLYVANADHTHPAAERPYVRLDLQALLSSARSAVPNP